MLHLERTELALENAKTYAPNESCQNDLIKSYLVQYLVVVFHSEMEERVATIIRNRLISGDQKLGCYISNTSDKMIRRTNKSDISELLKLFGNSVNDEFNKIIAAQEVTCYQNVITARHSIAHSRGSNVTLAELEKGVAATSKILEAIEKVVK